MDTAQQIDKYIKSYEDWRGNILVRLRKAIKDASLKDSDKLFNNGFDSRQHRAIDFSENDKVNETALKDLIKEAVALSTAKK